MKATKPRIAIVLKFPAGDQYAFLAPEGWTEKWALEWGVRIHRWPDSVFVMKLAEIKP